MSDDYNRIPGEDPYPEDYPDDPDEIRDRLDPDGELRPRDGDAEDMSDTERVEEEIGELDERVRDED